MEQNKLFDKKHETIKSQKSNLKISKLSVSVIFVWIFKI